jgi:hypothetical protein
VAGLYLSLPPYLTVGPRLVFPALIGVMLVPLVLTHGSPGINHIVGLTMTAVMTVALVVSLWLLIAALPSHKESGWELIRSAASLWATNVLVFALWYWRLDAGGPYERDLREQHTRGAFLFPQMQMQLARPDDDDTRRRWAPQFIDYLFLAFNTSTAFSPTDTPILTRWGKILMMVQSMISLSVLALLAARAVNIL